MIQYYRHVLIFYTIWGKLLYYGVRLPSDIRDKIVSIFERHRVVRNIFDNNIPQFTRSAIIFQITAYYLLDKIDMSLVSIYDETKTISIVKIQNSIMSEIRELLNVRFDVRKKYSNSMNKFVIYAILKHLEYWEEICFQLEKDKSS